MPELTIYSPTYYGGSDAVDRGNKPEFGDPRVPIVIRSADGVRIVLGTKDFWDNSAPDIQVERRPNGWAIFLHPLGGGDPSGYIYFIDDGRSFVVPESAIGGNQPIAMADFDTATSEVDKLKPSAQR